MIFGSIHILNISEDTECRLAADPVVLVLGEYQMPIAKYLRVVSLKF